MALTLSYRADTSVPVEIEGLTPEAVRGSSLDEIRRFEIFHGNEKLSLGQMFDLKGDAADGRFDFEGDLSGVHWIGAQMSEGQIHIHGNGGRHIGSEMSGGEIHVEGDAGGWAGCEMRGGLIHVQGRAGHLAGAAYRGSPQGMTGGTILIEGDAGDEVGLSMRRGTIAVGGRVGDVVGFNMFAGSIVVLGDCGIRPGAGMRRGTLLLLGPEPPTLLPSFRYDCTARPQILPLIVSHLNRLGMNIEQQLLERPLEHYHGDLVALGRGEILLRHVGASIA